MKIAKTKWEAYIRSLEAINSRAANEMVNYAAQHGIEDRKALIDYAAALTTKYGEGSAELACEMYDAIAKLQNAHVPEAEPAEMPDYGEVAKSVNGTLKQSPEGELIGDAVGRLVKRAGADTMLKNAKRDHAEFAWIPSGDACVFCQVIASRGWQRASNKTIKGDHAEHIHANCNCEFAIRFTPELDVAGYEPEKLREEYDSAEGNTPQDKVNSMRRAKYNAEKEQQGQQAIENAIVEQLNNTTGSSGLTDAIINNHEGLALFTPEGMKTTLEQTGYEVKPLGHGGLKGVSFEDGGGYRINYGRDGIFQYHPEKGSHHGGAYWKVKNGEKEARYDMDGNIKKQ